MTSLVGILCQDGVVIGADSSATFGQPARPPIMEQPYEKIDVIANHVILAGTGEIGLGQRFRDVTDKAWHAGIFKDKDVMSIEKKLSSLAIKDFSETHLNKVAFGALVAFSCNNKHHLVEYSLDTFQPEMKTEKLWFVSMGSAQYITDTFLAFLREVFWTDRLPNIHEGIFAAKWTLDHAVSINAGGVNGPVRISVLEKGDKGDYQARILTDDDLQEHAQAIKDAKSALVGFSNKYQSVNHDEVPSIPQP